MSRHRGWGAGAVAAVAFLVPACSFSGHGNPDRTDGPGGDGIDGRRADGAPIIDASPPDATVDARPCPPPPSDCAAFRCASSSTCYYVCAPRGYGAARDRCTSAGIGCLATIDDQAENDCVAAMTSPSFPDLVWFGFVQAPGASEPAGGWGWECGTSGFVAGNWGGFEPNDEDGEDCGAMGGGGAWIDGDCGTQLRYVCELVP